MRIIIALLLQFCVAYADSRDRESMPGTRVRTVGVPPVHSTDLDSTMLGKPGHLVSPRSNLGIRSAFPHPGNSVGQTISRVPSPVHADNRGNNAFDGMAEVFKDPAKVEQVKKAMSNPQLMKSMYSMAGNMMKSKDVQERIQALENDPEMKPIFEDIRKNGAGAMMKYYSDPKFLRKITEVMPADEMIAAAKDAGQQMSSATPSAQVDAMEKLQAVRMDPELKTAFDEINKDAAAAMKYFNDPEFMRKVSDKMGEESAMALKASFTTAASLAAAEYEGYAEDETVQVVVRGNLQPKSVVITEAAMDSGATVLSQRVTEAMQDAYKEATAAMQEKVKGLQNGNFAN